MHRFVAIAILNHCIAAYACKVACHLPKRFASPSRDADKNWIQYPSQRCGNSQARRGQYDCCVTEKSNDKGAQVTVTFERFYLTLVSGEKNDHNG